MTILNTNRGALRWAITLTLTLAVSAAFSLPGQQQKKKPVKAGVAAKAGEAAKTGSTDAKLAALGKTVYDAQGCGGCHAVAGKGGNSGPDLTSTGGVTGHNLQWFEAQVATPKAHNPNSTMPAFPQIKGDNQVALATFLVSLKGTVAVAAGGGAAGYKAATRPDATVLAKIEKAGGSVGPLAQNDDHLAISFHMAGAAVTDKDVAPVSSLKDVQILDLGQTGITDAGLMRIAGLKGLTELHLENTHITDAGLAALKNMTQLSYLNLYGTGITDAGLERLVTLKSLRHLYVWQTKVTQAGADKLKQALPQVDIVMGWETAPKK